MRGRLFTFLEIVVDLTTIWSTHYLVNGQRSGGL